MPEAGRHIRGDRKPWMTPFLGLVHALCHSPLRHMWGKLDALATMIEHEEKTYKQ